MKCIYFVIGESLEDLKKKYLNCIEALNAADSAKNGVNRYIKASNSVEEDDF